MNIYDKLLELTDTDTVQLASEFRNSIGKELILGQTRFMCRYGTLSDGHEKLTESQRYYQSIKEMHSLASNMRVMRAQSMINQAKIIRAEEKLKKAKEDKNRADEFEAMGELAIAQESLLNNLTTVEDQTRMLDEYNKIRLELKPMVEAKYPEGIEQAEKDNWMAVLKHRINQRHAGLQQHLTHVPMDAQTKAEFGLEYNAPDLWSWLEVSDPQKMFSIAMEKRAKVARLVKEEMKKIEN